MLTAQKERPFRMKAHRPMKNWKKSAALTTMVAPGAIWYLLVRYLPMFGIVMAFIDYRLPTKKLPFPVNIFRSPWVGLDNFKFLFTRDGAVMIQNTLLYNIVWIALGLVVAVAFAVMMSQLTRKLLAKTYQTLMFFPYFLSWVVASYFLLAFLDPVSGMVVHMQKAAGVTPIDWYNQPAYWPVLLTICNLWKNVGYSTVLYLAAITGIDQSQYEAAAVDGASKWQQVVHVTLPHIRPMIVILLIMNVGKIFNADFGLFFSVPLNSAPLFPVTQVVDTYVYRTYRYTRDLGMSSAAGFLQNLVGFVCLVAANFVVRKIDEESSLF